MGQSRWIDDDQIRRKRTLQFSEPRVHCPEERPKVKEVENYQYTSVLMGETIETVFRTIISVTQLSIYGAVSDLCDEYSACQASTGRPVLAGQSDPLFEPARLLMTTPAPSTEVPAQENLLPKYKGLLQQDRVIAIFTDAGFLKTVEVGQYFMTKGHWRVLTIYRVSGLSWVHFAKRWKIIWPESLDSREYQNWARVRSHNHLVAR